MENNYLLPLSYSLLDVIKIYLKRLVNWIMVVFINTLLVLFILTVTTSPALSLSIYVAFLAGWAIVFVLHQYYNFLQEKEFREFLGCELAGDRVALVIPRFPTEEIKKMMPDIFNINFDDARSIKRLNKVDNTVVAKTDIRVASDFLAAFRKVNLSHLVEIFLDDDILEKWKNGKASNIKTFIVIGLYSNRFFWEINDAPNIRKYFKTEELTQNQSSFRIAKRSGNIMDWHFLRKTDREKQDFVLISKVRLNSSQNALIVGGTSAKGTERIGEYLRENWGTIYNWLDISASRQNTLKNNEFAMSISVSPPKGEIRLEDLYIN